jgi:predicted RNase H-like HicB family nuclease
MEYGGFRSDQTTAWKGSMAMAYTAVIQQSGEWWIGWVEEVPGVNSQGETREELLDNLRDALEEA